MVYRENDELNVDCVNPNGQVTGLLEWLDPVGEVIGNQLANRISLGFTLDRNFAGTYFCQLRNIKRNIFNLPLPPSSHFTIEVHCKFLLLWLFLRIKKSTCI